MCLMPRIYVTAIYGEPQQQDAPEPDVLPEEAPEATAEHELVSA